jgi:hypothetical protein
LGWVGSGGLGLWWLLHGLLLGCGGGLLHGLHGQVSISLIFFSVLISPIVYFLF